MNQNNIFTGTCTAIGEKNFQKLQNSHVAIIGVGGVGSFSVEVLARSGVGEITLFDLDEICISNINRQIQALLPNVGKFKIDALKERMLNINPDLKINLIYDFYTKETASKLFKLNPDFILDAIDSLSSKCHLIAKAKKLNIPIATSGSAGGKIDPSLIQIKDLNFSYNDSLLFRVRKKLRQEYHFHRFPKKKYKINCVFSSEVNTKKIGCQDLTSKNKCEINYGSLCSITSIFGIMLAHIAIEHIINQDG